MDRGTAIEEKLDSYSLVGIEVKEVAELERYRALFANLEAVLTKCEPEHIRLNRYAGTVCAGIKDSSKPGSPIFRFKGASVVEALGALAAGVE